MAIHIEAQALEQLIDEPDRGPLGAAEVARRAGAQHPVHRCVGCLGPAETAETAIASRSAPERMPGVEHGDAKAGPGEAQRGGQPGKARADDRDIGLCVAVKRRPVAGHGGV